ncbi:SprT family zinc-dependent metalloprotease [Dyadobacter aurulentus]|uniref:hypothetical protein n=1 Tax=Dyadobacter sp. UC 10 TaxID=2605428 RepID=UPI0011F10CAD|nr:hypothetical protein [Dyadobacter sp. UC 10]KAA0990955.1 hypothetical protein FXO21_12720 [Dyadobacter sp. UC 10]
MKSTSFRLHVPSAASEYCDWLFSNHKFVFLLSRPRRTRLGDFTVKPGLIPKITVNANLNPYSFLITYLHEVAHCVVHYKYKGRLKKRVAPHGQEWKHEFGVLLQPVLTESVFPKDILVHLVRYSKNPTASTGGDQLLFNALRKYDDQAANIGRVLLAQLHEGSNFVFQNRTFTRGILRRTRILCTDKASQRLYTIPAHALVEAC